MTATIGRVAYVATFDATDLSKGMMTAQSMFRAQKKITEEMKSPLERYQQGLTNLEKLVDKYPAVAGRKVEMEKQLEREYLKQEQSLRKLTTAEASRLRELTAGERAAEQAAAAEKRLNRARSEAKSAIDANRTAIDRYSRTMASHNNLLKRGLIDQGTYNRAVRNARGEMLSSLPVVGRFGTALMHPGIAAAGAAMGAIAISVANISKEMAYLDTVAKDAARLDIDPEAFLVLGRAASHAGVEQDRLFDAMGKLQKRLGEASMGSKQAAESFSRLGLDFSKLQSITKEDQFLAVSDALAGLRDNTERMAAANQIFGRGGQELLSMLSLTTDEFAALRAEMDRRGELFSAEELSRVEAANDALADLSVNWRAFWQNAAVAVSPSIKALSEMADQLGGLAKLMSYLPMVMGPAFAATDAVGRRMLEVEKLDRMLKDMNRPETELILTASEELPDDKAARETKKKPVKPVRDKAAELEAKQARELIKIEQRLMRETMKRADIDMQRTHMLERQLELRKKMADLPVEKQQQIGTVAEKLNAQLQIVEERRQREQQKEQLKGATSQNATSINANSQEAYQFLVQAMRNNPLEQQRVYREKQILAIEQRQTDILQQLLSAIEEIEPIGTIG